MIETCVPEAPEAPDAADAAWCLSERELVTALVGLEQVAREVYARQLVLLAEARRRGGLGGYGDVRGFLDPETATTLEGLFGPLAKPPPVDAEGRRDQRTRDERHGDALAEIVDSAARTDELTVQGGERAVLTVTIPLAELESRTHRALLEAPGCTSLDQLRRLACQAEVVPAIFGNDSQPLYPGRSERHATKAQRRALALRDKGCAFPGCDRPPKWTVPHHIHYWINTGPTDIDNLVLVCVRHHRMLHHTDWEVRINPVDQLPEFLPPPRLDPQRTPLRNRAHGVIGAWPHRDRPPPQPSPWRRLRRATRVCQEAGVTDLVGSTSCSWSGVRGR